MVCVVGDITNSLRRKIHYVVSDKRFVVDPDTQKDPLWYKIQRSILYHIEWLIYFEVFSKVIEDRFKRKFYD